MKKDIEQLQGTWNIVSLEMDGRKTPASGLGGASIAIQGERFTSTGMGAAYEGTIEVNAAAKPKTFDLNFTTCPEKGNTNLGIYELNGDKWRICLSTRGTTRPRKFAAEPGTGIVVEVLQRGDAVPALNLDNVKFEPAAELQGQWSMVSGTMDGQPLDKSLVKVGKRVVKGNDMAVVFGQDTYSKARYTVDRSKTPAAIDFYNTEGGNAGRLLQGIYEVNGKTLKLCIAAAGRERPNDFTSTPGEGRTLVVWTQAAK